MPSTSNQSLSSEPSEQNNNQRRCHQLNVAIILGLGILSLMLLGVILYAVATIYLSSTQETKESKQAIRSNVEEEDGAIHMRIPPDHALPGPPRVSAQERRSPGNPIAALQRARASSPQRGRRQQQQPLPQRQAPPLDEAPEPIQILPQPPYPPLHALWNQIEACSNFYEAVCGGLNLASKQPKNFALAYTANWHGSFAKWLNEEIVSPRIASSRAVRVIVNLYRQCGEPILEKLMKQHVLVLFRIYLVYTESHASTEVRDDINYVTTLFETIRRTFDHMLKSETHYPALDPATRERMRDKLKKMTPLIGYPDFVLDDQALDWYYSDSPESIIILPPNDKNCELHYRALSIEYMLRVNNSPDALQRKWAKGICLIGSIASYKRVENLIGVSMMNFHRPFFDRAYPPALNYALLGWTMAHEITHGFDKGGCGYDGEGNEAQICTPKVHEWFQKEADCFEEQYGQHPLSKIRRSVTGMTNQTLDEDIADNGAIRIAHKAFMKHEKARSQPQLRPNLNYPENSRHSAEQLFFITYARQWCMAMDFDDLVAFSKDTHSYPELRVNMVLKNFKAFRKVFHCTKGVHYMAPLREDRCELW